MDIKEGFDTVSRQYDRQRRQLIPCFDDFYNLSAAVLDAPTDSPQVLDIGCGTGLFSEFVLQKYPKACMTLIDLSDKMLEVARERFAGRSGIRYINADYTCYQFGHPFDIIVSALSIHHLPAAKKEKLYRRCFGMLRPGGIFVNADQVLSPSSSIESIYSKLWKDTVENSGLAAEEVEQAYARTAFDDPSTLDDQLRWLTEAGFSQVDCIYKYYHFAVFYAKK